MRLQIVASMTGKVLVISDPLYVSGPQSCGIFGASPGYVTNGQVRLLFPPSHEMGACLSWFLRLSVWVLLRWQPPQSSWHTPQAPSRPGAGYLFAQLLSKALQGSFQALLLHVQVYIYSLDSNSEQYKLSQTLEGNSSSVTGFGTDIGESHAITYAAAMRHYGLHAIMYAAAMWHFVHANDRRSVLGRNTHQSPTRVLHACLAHEAAFQPA